MQSCSVCTVVRVKCCCTFHDSPFCRLINSLNLHIPRFPPMTWEEFMKTSMSAGKICSALKGKGPGFVWGFVFKVGRASSCRARGRQGAITSALDEQMPLEFALTVSISPQSGSFTYRIFLEPFITAGLVQRVTLVQTPKFPFFQWQQNFTSPLHCVIYCYACSVTYACSCV